MPEGSAMTPAERLEAAGRWLASVGGDATSGDLGAALGLNHARQADVTRDLRAGQWVTGPKGTLHLTPAGWARFGGVEPVSAGAVLDRVLDGWPYTHRAFLELLVSTVIVRHHLGAERRAGHLAFIAIGETGTGKSAMGGLVCHLFGFLPALHTLHMPDQSAGDLLGRRDQDGGEWRWRPADTTRLPFVVLDEFDKAPEPVQRRALIYLHDVMDHRLEGQVHELLPTPLLLANPPRTGPRYAHLRQEYRRRSVVLDTGAMAGRADELEDLLTGFYARTSPADHLPLDRLVPPAALDARGREVLASLRNMLTPAGLEEFPGVRPLELATLGRCALMGPDADHGLAAFATSVAYLQATESVAGQVADGWVRDLGDVQAKLGDAGTSIVAALERAKVERAQAAAAATDAHRRRARTDVAIREAGEVLAERCRQQITALHRNKITPDRRPDAAGLRRTLHTFATTAAQVSTAASLAEVTAAAAEPLERARQLVAEVAAGRLATEQAAWDTRRQDQADRAGMTAERQRVKTAPAARRREVKDSLASVVATAEPLEAAYRRTTTRPKEDVLARLQELRVNGLPLLVHQAPPERPRERGFLAALGRVLTPEQQGSWQVSDAGVTFPGSLRRCEALATWGLNTRKTLAPALGVLHAREDELRQELGCRPRKCRPQVPRPGAQPAPRELAAAPAWVPSNATKYGLGR